MSDHISQTGKKVAARRCLHRLVKSTSDLFCFRWWYKGRSTLGVTISYQGDVMARNESEACAKVEAAMRGAHPTLRWMDGREIEGHGIKFGPTVQKKRSKQNNKLTNRPSK